MTSTSVEEIVNDFISKVVANDLDGACALVSNDIEYDNVPLGKNIGPDALKGFFGAMTGQFDEVVFVLHRQVCSGNIVMNERSDRFRKGDVWIDLPVAGIFEVNADGKVSLWRDYFDMKMFTDQMAALG